MRYMRITDGIGTINVPGDWTLLESHDIEEELGESLGKGVSRYVVDFSGTDSIDYASVQFLNDLLSRVGADKMVICNVSPKSLVLYMLEKSDLVALII